jgi:hypothetical protein
MWRNDDGVPASKRALVNQNGRVGVVGVIRCTRWDTLNVQWTVRSSSILSASVGELILLLLSRAEYLPSQIYMFWRRSHSVRFIPSTRAPSSTPYPLQHSTYPNASSSIALSIILDFVFIPGTIYQTPYFQPHLNDSSTENIGVLLVGSSMESKKLEQRQQQEQLQ